MKILNKKIEKFKRTSDQLNTDSNIIAIIKDEFCITITLSRMIYSIQMKELKTIKNDIMISAHGTDADIIISINIFL